MKHANYFLIQKLCCSILLLLMIVCVNAQETRLFYNVKKGGKKIGSFTVIENSLGTTKNIKLESHIKTSFVVAVEVDAQEESSFQNGLLNNSFVYRKVNGDEKINKRHTYYGNGYIVESGKMKDSLCCIKIFYNLMSLYVAEPVHVSKVYSDNYQKFLAIKNLGGNTYKIDMPDGSYNTYSYKGGKCVKVEIHQSLYTITMELA